MAFDKNIFDINGKDILSMATFADEDVIAFDNIRDICLNEKVKIENFIIALCNKGRGALTINGVDYNVDEKDGVYTETFVMNVKDNLDEIVDSGIVPIETEGDQDVEYLSVDGTKQALEAAGWTVEK